MSGGPLVIPADWNVVLESERLLLRRFVVEDAPLLVELDADPEVRRHVAVGPAPTLAFYRDEKLPEWIAYYDRGPFGYWAAHEKPGLGFVGWFHLRPEREGDRSQDLGYRLKRDSWGRGLATEGSLGLIEKAWNDWDARRITAHALVSNLSSIKVMRKCGMRRVGEFTVPEARLPGTSEESRRAVGYEIFRPVEATHDSDSGT